MLFLANVNLEDAHAWYMSTGMSLLQDRLGSGFKYEFPQIRGTLLKVPILRVLVWVYFGKLPNSLGSDYGA